MLRDVIVHILNEQPILADLVKDPTPTDVALICSNLRTMGGKKPVFIDKTDSTFVLPLAHVRFVEIPRASVAASEAERATLPDKASAVAGEDEHSAAPLARLAWLTGEAGEQVAAADDSSLGAADPPDPPNSDEIDPDLLRRIHEV